MQINSKLPNLPPNIFSVMSALATECGAINLAQGFPDFPPDASLADLMHHYISAGVNQYAPGIGVAELRKQLGRKMRQREGADYDIDTELTITSGASEAIFSTILALVATGDEVIILEPAYDIYAPIVELAGGVVRRVALSAEDFSLPWAQLRASIGPNTRMIIINTPHNPSGAVLGLADLQQLAELLADTNIIVLSDEVYSDLVYMPGRHRSAASVPELKARSVVVGSLGKTFHLTGWKVGFCFAPAELMAEIRKVHSINTFSVHTPSQYALADLLAQEMGQAPTQKARASAARVFAPKRDYFIQGLANTKWRLLAPKGGYFITADYSQIDALKGLTDYECCKRLTREFGVAAIPYSAFYEHDPQLPLIRFCFAKQKDTLEQALSKLRAIV